MAGQADKKQCSNCGWWMERNNTEAYDFGNSIHSWGMCRLTTERRDDFGIPYAESKKQRVELGKPIAICEAEGMMDAELMTVESFSCSEFILDQK